MIPAGDVAGRNARADHDRRLEPAAACREHGLRVALQRQQFGGALDGCMRPQHRGLDEAERQQQAIDGARGERHRLRRDGAATAEFT